MTSYPGVGVERGGKIIHFPAHALFLSPQAKRTCSQVIKNTEWSLKEDLASRGTRIRTPNGSVMIPKDTIMIPQGTERWTVKIYSEWLIFGQTFFCNFWARAEPEMNVFAIIYIVFFSLKCFLKDVFMSQYSVHIWYFQFFFKKKVNYYV